MLQRAAIAASHVFMAFFVGVQTYAFFINFYEENMSVMMALFVILSTVIFYLAFKKADPKHYTFKHVFLFTAGYWIISTVILLAKLVFLNIFLVGGFFYYLTRKNPTDTLAADAA